MGRVMGLTPHPRIEKGCGAGWPADGGQASGRKHPIIFAGFMLGYTPMMSVGADYPAESNTFGEDCQTYYDDPAYPTFSGMSRFPRWGIRHCQDPTFRDPDRHVEGTTSYWQCCTVDAWNGQALAARIMGLEVLWNHQAYFDNIDRWFDDVAAGRHGAGNHGSAFSNEMFRRLRPSLNTCRNGVHDRCSGRCVADPAEYPPVRLADQRPLLFAGEISTDAGDVCE